jgi:hypothetical protein
VCLDCFSHRYGRSLVQNLTIQNFDFIIILAQIINNFSKVRQKKISKKNYGEIVKVLRYYIHWDVTLLKKRAVHMTIVGLA